MPDFILINFILLENLTTQILLLFIVMSFLFTFEKVIWLESYKSEAIVETYNIKIKLLKSKENDFRKVLKIKFCKYITVNQLFLLT